MSNNSHNHHSPHASGTQNFMNKIAFLDSDMRKNTFPPEEILKILPMQKDYNVLDAGAGSGYLTIPVAKRTEGAVFALDMDVRMLEVIGTKAKAEKLTNIRLIQGNIEKIPLSDGTVDIALASLILHEVRELSSALTQINRVLKTDGRFLCIEYEKEEDATEGTPMHMRISSEEMEKALIETGFQIVQKVFLRESIYIVTATKAGSLSNG